MKWWITFLLYGLKKILIAFQKIFLPLMKALLITKTVNKVICNNSTASRSFHVGFVVDALESAKVFLWNPPVFLRYKFHSTDFYIPTPTISLISFIAPLC